MRENKQNVRGILLILLPFFLIDGVELFGRVYNPASLGNFACFVFPYLKISTLFIPHQLVAFANDQCTIVPQEPAMSIIFFVLKITTALLLGIGLVLRYMLILGLTPPDPFSFSELKKTTAVTVGLSLVCLFFYADINFGPSQFGISFGSKIGETFVCLIISITAGLIFSNLALPIRFCLWRLNHLLSNRSNI